MLRSLKKLVSLVLVLALSLVVFIPAFAVKTKTEVKDSGPTIKNISSIIFENNRQYDLSNLKDASAYFQHHQNKISFSGDIINQSIHNLAKYKETLADVGEEQKIDHFIALLKQDNSQHKTLQKHFSQDVTYFDLQTELDTNTQTMYDFYNATYAAAGVGINAAAIAYAETGVFFASMEHSGGDWDYKQNFDSYDSPVEAYIDGRYVSMQAQDVGNIHYGYVGSTYFAPTVLKSAAGMAQLASGHPYWDFSSYFDDPRDQKQIQRGISYFKTGSFN